MGTPWVPFAGYARLADRIKAQIETSLVDVQTGQVMVVTADRREAPNSGFQSDLVRFLERLAKGEAVRAD